GGCWMATALTQSLDNKRVPKLADLNWKFAPPTWLTEAQRPFSITDKERASLAQGSFACLLPADLTVGFRSVVTGLRSCCASRDDVDNDGDDGASVASC